MNLELCDSICELLSDKVPRTRKEIEKSLSVRGIYPELHYLLHLEEIYEYAGRNGLFVYAPNHYPERIIWVVNDNNETIGCHVPYNFNAARERVFKNNKGVVND